jgi:hypothetical protein
MSADVQPASALPEFTRWLAGSERPRPASHKHIEPLHPDEAVTFMLILRRRPGTVPSSQTPFDGPSSISREEYVQMYGADPIDLESAVAFLQVQGMSVLEAHAGRRTLSVLATAAQVQSVFGVNLQRYEDAGAIELLPPNGDEARAHRGFDGAVYLPAELAECVTAVVGLDNRFLGIPRGAATSDGVGPSNPTVSAVAQKLKIPNTGAYGEVIGIFAAQPAGSPGIAPCYLPSDITHLYFANQPIGYRTRPLSILDINLTVGATTYKNDPSQVEKIAVLSDADSATLELTQEIATSVTVAQGARASVYFTEASEQGYLTFMNRVLLPEREKQPTVLSFSLALCEGAAAKDGAPHAGSSSLAYLVEDLFHQIALLGISIFIAMGERGSDCWRLLAAPNLSPAAVSPQLHHSFQGVKSSSATIATALSAASLLPASRAAGGGDFSTVSGATGIPDIGSEAAYGGFFVNGVSYSYAGPSCVAAFYAGTTALLRSAFGTGLGFLNSMLFQLKKTRLLKNNPNRDGGSRDLPGTTADESDHAQPAAPDAQFFSRERPSRSRLARWFAMPLPMSTH